MSTLRWRKNPLPTGLARVCAGPQGSNLYYNGTVHVAAAYSLHRSRNAWYWVAGWSGRDLGIAHANTCAAPVSSEAEAKDAAMAYVRAALATAATKAQQP